MEDNLIECEHDWQIAPNDPKFRVCMKCGEMEYCGTAEEMLQDAMDYANKDAWRLVPYLINIYVCPNGHITTTVDVDKGTTPFQIGCLQCGELAKSFLYPKERPIPAKVPAPSFEWYKPGPDDEVPEGNKQHVELGGLLLRPIQTPQIDWLMHERPSKVKGFKSSKTDEQRVLARKRRAAKRKSQRRNR